MRYAKWLIVSCVLVVIAFTILCARAVFSVASINVDYSYFDTAEVEKANDLLDHYYGASLIFIREDKVIDLINENTGLKVESVTKKFPNVLEIKLNERQECFCIKSESGYLILDDEYTVVDIRDNPKNSVDGLDNIILNFGNSEFDASLLHLRSTLDIGREDLLKSVTDMIAQINSPRDFIKEITVEEKEKGINYYVNFKTFEGVVIEVRKALDNPTEKITLAQNKYLSLFDRDKLTGKIAVYTTDNGQTVATYTNQ